MSGDVGVVMVVEVIMVVGVVVGVVVGRWRLSGVDIICCYDS